MNAPYSKIRTAVAVGLALGLGCSLPALADGGHHHHFHHDRVDVFVGFGDPFWPGYGPPYPAVVAVPSEEAPTYIEKGSDGPSPSPAGSYYYCDQSQAYYPAVTDCPGGWKQVTPVPRPMP